MLVGGAGVGVAVATGVAVAKTITGSVGVDKGAKVLTALGVLVGVGVTWLTAERHARIGITRTTNINFNKREFIKNIHLLLKICRIIT